MTLTMDPFRVMARVRDLHIDDVKATKIKEKKENTCLLYMEIFISQSLIQIFAQTLMVCLS